MHRAIRNGVLLLLIAAMTGCGTTQPAQPTAEEGPRKEGAWITLFDGTKSSLEGWRQAGPGRFVLQDGHLTSEGGMGLFYYADRSFRDYELRLDWKVATDSANSGIFLRFPEQTDDPWYAVEHGYEIQINDSGDPMHRTGAVYDTSASFRMASREPGRWNTYRIRVTGQRYRIWLNGKKVNDFVGDRGREGYIGLQNHDPDSKVSFRDVRVRPLPNAPTPESLADVVAAEEPGPGTIDVLMLTSTYGFRHEEAIATSKPVLESLEETTEFRFTVTEDVSTITADRLQRYDLLFFNNTSGNLPMTEAQKEAIRAFMRDGNGFVGAHAASDTWYNWAPYREMLGGGLFEDHPWTQSVRVSIEDEDNPAVDHLGSGFWLRDEIYRLDANPRWNSHVLASLDMASVGVVEGPASDDRNDYPISWIRNYGGGRVFYTKLGHFADVWTTPAFLEHLLDGMRMAAGTVEADFSGHREKDVISEGVWPDDIALDERGNVWIAELQGKVHRYDAAADATRQIATVPTTDPTNIEHGLLGIEVDPDFYDGEPYVYLFYTEQETIINTLSRFEYRDGQIDLSSEKVLLRVPTEPHCCHQAGDLEWGPDGKLYLSTGDTGMSSTEPSWELSQDSIQAFVDRYGLEDYHWSRLVDSERTAQNLQDLRGKILRINPDGTIPKDNPFYGEPGVRWEIYAYGLRNPYRFKVDEQGHLYIGVVGPDAVFDYDEYNFAEEGGVNFGWPREIGRLLYNEWTRDMIPDYRPSIWEYTYETGGRSATMGPIYRAEGEHAFPEAFQDRVFVYDWARRWIKWGKLESGHWRSDVENSVKPDPEADTVRTERLHDIKTFDTLTETTPISMEVGPEGALYVANFTGFWGPAPGSMVTRYRWVEGNQPPVAVASAETTSGPAPLAVSFDGSRSYDPNADVLDYTWSFGDGSTGSGVRPEHVYEEEGTYRAVLRVRDTERARSRRDTVTVTVGNTAPTAAIDQPGPGTLIDPAVSPLTLEGGASDPEDGALAGARLDWTVTLHYLDGTSWASEKIAEGSGATMEVELADSYASWGDTLRYEITLEATDSGGLTDAVTHTLRYSRLQAEIADHRGGFALEEDGGFLAGTRINDFVGWSSINLNERNGVVLRVSPGTRGGELELRLDDVRGKLIGTAELQSGEDSERTWTTKQFSVSDVRGIRDVYVVLTEHGEGDVPVAVDWLQVEGPGTYMRTSSTR